MRTITIKTIDIMKKIILATLFLLAVSCINIFSQTLNTGESKVEIQNFSVKPLPPRTIGDEKGENRIEIFFEAKNIERIEKVKVSIQDKSNNEILKFQTINFQTSADKVFYFIDGLPREVRANTVAFYEYIGELELKDVLVEVYCVDNKGNISNKVHN